MPLGKLFELKFNFCIVLFVFTLDWGDLPQYYKKNSVVLWIVLVIINMVHYLEYWFPIFKFLAAYSVIKF